MNEAAQQAATMPWYGWAVIAALVIGVGYRIWSSKHKTRNTPTTTGGGGGKRQRPPQDQL